MPKYESIAFAVPGLFHLFISRHFILLFSILECEFIYIEILDSGKSYLSSSYKKILLFAEHLITLVKLPLNQLALGKYLSIPQQQFVEEK